MCNLFKSFLICWLLMFSKGAQSQKKISDFLELSKKNEYLRIFKTSSFPTDGQPKSPIIYTRTSIISPGLYASCLGVICKTELKMDKVTPMPFRFRLGSLEYVNWMEGKPGFKHIGHNR